MVFGFNRAARTYEGDEASSEFICSRSRLSKGCARK